MITLVPLATMPCAHVIMVVVLLTMIAFYATSFDSIALTASCYSYHRLGDNEQPNKGIQLMWCILLILLPMFPLSEYEFSQGINNFASLFHRNSTRQGFQVPGRDGKVDIDLEAFSCFEIPFLGIADVEDTENAKSIFT